MKSKICKILCEIGLHKIDRKDWREREDFDGNIYLTNYCKRCGQIVERR